MISSVPGIVSLSGGWLSLLEEAEDDETGDSVQFVIKMTAIEKAEETVVDETPVVQRNFWQKLIHLFGLDK